MLTSVEVGAGGAANERLDSDCDKFSGGHLRTRGHAAGWRGQARLARVGPQQ